MAEAEPPLAQGVADVAKILQVLGILNYTRSYSTQSLENHLWQQFEVCWETNRLEGAGGEELVAGPGGVHAGEEGGLGGPAGGGAVGLGRGGGWGGPSS